MDKRKTINNYLGNRGLSTMDDPRGMVAQLGFLVEDDQHFKQLLNKCQPQFRRDMYEALRPHLRFEARPLDVYIAEIGMDAEIQQLPTVDETGKFHAFRPAEIRSLDEAVGQEIHRHVLEVTCRKCTRSESFFAERKADAIDAARNAGWAYDAIGKYEICPSCLN